MVRKSAGMGAWLATLDADRLLGLLRARPDAALPPAPTNPAELAARLSATHSVQRALAVVGLPALQVAEALLALGGTASRAELARLLHAEEGEASARLDRAVDELSRLALLWPMPAGLRLAGAWRDLMPEPLALGRSCRELFELLTVAQLGRIGSALGLGGYVRKSEWVEAVAAAVANPATVEGRLERAQPEVAAAVRKIAWHGPQVSGVHLPGAYERVDSRDIGVQLAVHGWVVPTEWGRVGEMPREVALAVRGAEYHAPFDPEPPAPATAVVDPEQLHAAGRHAANNAVDAVRRFLALLERSPLTFLQAGGVGVRELRRTAKQLAVDEAAVRLWLEVAASAGLVAAADEGVLASTAADEWLADEPAAALARVLVAWWRLAATPSHRVDETGRPAPALGWAGSGPDAIRLRADVLHGLARLCPAGPGRGLADPADITAQATLLAHRRPVAYHSPEAVAPRLRATLAEAELLGLVAEGALTPLGFHLLAAVDAPDPEAALSAAAAGLLPPPSTTARFLPDLTVVVAGVVGTALSRLLDETAEVESRDTASTWRFTPASVRRALDAGRTADSVLAALTEVAENPLPQPLEYLVRDVARRHGELEIIGAACCVRVVEPALAAEVAAHRKLAALNLRLVAETVLVSAKPAGETISALRAAGYAPVRRNTRGETLIERTPARRADPPQPRPRRAHPHQPVDLPALARRLAAGGSSRPTVDPAPSGLADDACALSAPEIAVLEFAIQHRLPVQIDYVSDEGGVSTRVIEPTVKLGSVLVAWCRLRQAERNFAMSRITAASPVEG